MSINLSTFRPNTNKEKFSYSGSGQATFQRSLILNHTTSVLEIENESISLSSDDDVGKIRLGFAPIMDSIGGKIGYFNNATDNDTSLEVTHDSIDTEVRFDEYLTDSEIYDSLEEGEYCVDYTNGILYYKKGTSDTDGTVTYKILIPYTVEEEDKL